MADSPFSWIDAAKPDRTESSGPASYDPDRKSKEHTVKIEPSNFRGILQQLALLYRLMKLAEYNIPEVDSMLVVDCCIVLGVDQTHMPATRQEESIAARRDVELDFTVPSGVMIMDLDSMPTMIGVQQQEM